MLSIVVMADKFIYVGYLKKESDGIYTITEAKNLRRYGTERGLGQLAIEGPQKETKLDDVGTVTEITSLRHAIPVDPDKWLKQYPLKK